MTDESDKRRRPHPYGFPFPPYHVQEALMADIYKCLDDGGVGIFESPTGTGKSLSLICSTLQWLLDQEAKDAAGEAGAGASPAPTSSTGGDPSWVDEQVAATAQQERAHLHSELVERRRLRKARVAAYAAHAAASSGAAASRPGRKRLPGEPSGNSGAGPSDPDGGESEFVVDWSGGKGDGAETIDPSLLADGTEEEDECRARCRQVLYSSRTHSQLAQVIGEVKKTSLAGKVSVVTIGARKTLCINESLGGLDGARLNDACRQLREKDKEQRGVEQRERSKAAAESARRRREGLTEEADEEAGRGGCPHLRGGAARQTRLVDQILSSPLEIEECASLGRAENSCPYYAARAALDEATLVALPYPSLLNSATRQALGVRLGGSVVLIDEAHNLIDTINEMHSVTLSARHLSECSAQLAQYEERYSGRLKPSNRTMVRRLLFVVRALRKALTPPRTAKGAAGAAAAVERIIYVNDLLSVYNLDNLNLLELKHFCEKSLIANKLQGFAEKSQRAAGPAGLVAGAGAHARDAPRVTLHPVIALLEGLAHSDKDARVLLHVEPLQPLRPPAASRPDSWLRVLHLNPATYFASILSEAHAVVLCGGTMQPFEDLRQQLFTNLPPGRLRTAAYGHVVPPERLAPVVFSTGPRGSPLSFSFGSRGAPALMDELGELLLALAATVPDGLVVFVPSFQYEAQLVARWEATGLWTKLDALKRTFREPRATADLDKVLSEYAATVAQRGGSGGGGGGGGALLLSVVGGKMSEGINFSDRLGRCVVMVGLPNANPYELTLQEKMGHLDAVHGVGAGRAYYANLCMKAVNQSIGRAIRHRADFAAIVLADARFVKPTVRSKLPAWIQRRVEAPDSFEGSMAAVRGFFARFPDP